MAITRGVKNGFIRNAAGEMVLWCNGTEVMAFDTDKASFFEAAPSAQIATIADATDTSASDQKAVINAHLVALETMGLVATS
jgi:hypothetical protein